MLFLGRTVDFLRIQSILNIVPDFYLHISNFSIGYFLFAGVGYFWLMAGVKFQYLLAYGFILLLINFIYELFIPVLNTQDIVDAYYGLVGILLGGIFLFFIRKFGLQPNPSFIIKA